MKALLVVGKSGSGKSTFLQISLSLGISSYDMSSVIYETMREKGMDLSPLNVIKFANSLREREGKDVVAKLLFKRIKKEKQKRVVITGLRSVYEYNFFSSSFDKTLLLYLSSSQSLRYERIKRRKKESNPISFEEFKEKDERESLWGMDELIKRADIIIENNSSLEEFKNKCISLLKFSFDL